VDDNYFYLFDLKSFFTAKVHCNPRIVSHSPELLHGSDASYRGGSVIALWRECAMASTVFWPHATGAQHGDPRRAQVRAAVPRHGSG
jgi:hypothetical protein